MTFRRFSIATLGYTLLVILWGAYVRASGSGAGCGSHWPTCNGQVIPRPESIETVIELTHRVTSGLALVLVVVQVVWALRVFDKPSPVRRWAGWSLFFMLTEALVGAGLVLFEMVADNQSTARGYWMSAHLINTFMLIGVLALTVHATYDPAGGTPVSPPKSGERAWTSRAVAACLALTLVVATTGAIAALGDTLFPVSSLREGIAQDLSPGAHILLRLRVLHPTAAVVAAIALVALCGRLLRTSQARGTTGPLHRRFRVLVQTIAGLTLVQIGCGVINLVLLAPIPLQLIHLLIADALWIALVMLARAHALGHDLATAGEPVGDQTHPLGGSSPVRGSPVSDSP